MDSEKIIATFQRVPQYSNRLLQKLRELKEIKKTQNHSADIECEIQMIEEKFEFIKEFFSNILFFLDITLPVLEEQFSDIDDLLE